MKPMASELFEGSLFADLFAVYLGALASFAALPFLDVREYASGTVLANDTNASELFAGSHCVFC